MTEQLALTLELRMLMGMMGRVSKQALEQYLAEQRIEMSMLQFGILHMLQEEAHTISDLSKKLVLDPSTLVPSIDALERKGWVVRGRDPHDRRRTPLSLTTEGEEIVRKLHHSVHESDPLNQALLAMRPEDQQQLLTLMRQLIAHMPDGDAMLQSVQARLKLYLSKEGKNPC